MENREEQKNLIGVWPNLSRAYEIAKLACLEIKVVSNSDPGNFVTETYPKLLQDLPIINEFFAGVNITTAPTKPHLTVEIHQPTKYDNRRHESMESVNNRILRATNTMELLKSLTIPVYNEASLMLYNTAIEKLGLGLHDCHIIDKTVIVIAALSDSTTVRVEHIAEAIQYFSY